MNIKVYNKRGKKNYKEVRIIKELEAELKIKVNEDPRLFHTFKPAETYEELQAMHAQYVSKDAEFEEIEIESKTKTMAKNQKEAIDQEIDQEDTLEAIEDDNSFIDPFNRQEPTTYDYTNDGGFSKDSTPKNTGQTDFAEPLSFNEAFEIPEEGEDEEPVDNEINSNRQKDSNQQRAQKKPPKKEEPWNPSFDDMSGGNQKKSTRKFAKYIIEASCALAEKGFVWFANKEINDAKLAEYELSGEMDLSILVTLENGQEATVKQFFQQQCVTAEELAKFEEEEKKDMAEALAAVLLEKGIAPTVTQEALIVVFGVLVKKGAIILSLKSQTSSLLNQLRVMKNPQQPQYEPQYQPEPQPIYEQPTYNEPNIQDVSNVAYDQGSLASDEAMLDIDMVVETKE